MSVNNNLKFLIERTYRAERKDNTLTFHEILRDMYIDKEMSIREISEEIGVSIGSIHNFLKEEGIQRNIKCKG